MLRTSVKLSNRTLSYYYRDDRKFYAGEHRLEEHRTGSPADALFRRPHGLRKMSLTPLLHLMGQ